jgi:hypothetical protein
VSGNRRSFLIPSIPDLVFAGLVCLQVVGASLILLNRDGDLPRHIAVGKRILENRSMVHDDFFSHTAYGQPFLAFEWLSEVIFAALYQTAGLDAVAAFTAIIIALAYAVLADFLIRRGVAADLVMLTVGLAALLGMTHWAARPHAFSFVFTVLLLRLLEPGTRLRLLMFVPLFFVWANLHPGFLFGLAILGVVAVGDLVGAATGEDRLRWRHAARYHFAALALASLATLLNPFGIGLHTHSIWALSNSEVISAVNEFKSPDFHTSAGMVFLIVLLVVIAAVAARRSRLDAPTLLIFLAMLAFSLRSRRHISLFGIVALPTLALALAQDWERSIPRVLREPGRALAYGDQLARRGGLAVAVIGFLIFAVLQPPGQRQYIATEFDARKFPVAAVKFARAAGVKGRLYNAYGWGGYIVLAWPQQPVFIDGLANFYGTQIFRDYRHVAELRPAWRDVLDRWNVDLVLDHAGSALVHELKRDAAWREVYRDDVAALLQRKKDFASH